MDLHLHDKLVLRGLQSEKEFLFPARVQRPLLGLRQDRVHHLVPPSVKKQAIKYRVFFLTGPPLNLLSVGR